MDQDRLDRIFARYRQNEGADNLAELFDLAAEDLFTLALRLMRDASAAEDVLQETFLELARGAQSHDGVRAAWPYLTGILRNRALAHRRREGRTLDESRLRNEEKASTPPDLVAERGEVSAWLSAAVAELPEASRRIVGHVLQDGLRPAEIAVRLGVTPGAVRTALHRGVARLRAQAPAGGSLPLALVVFEGRGLCAVRKAVLSEAAPVAVPTVAATTTSATLGSAVGTKLALGGLALVLVTGAGLLYLTLTAKDSEGLNSNSAVVAEADDQPRRDPRRALAGKGSTTEASTEKSPERSPALEAEKIAASGTKPTADPFAEIELLENEFVLRAGEGYSFAAGAVAPLDEADFIYEKGPVMRAPKGMLSGNLAGAYMAQKRSPVALMNALVEVGYSPIRAFYNKTPAKPTKGRSETYLFALTKKDEGWTLVCLVEERGNSARFRFRQTSDPKGRFGVARRPISQGPVVYDQELLAAKDPVYEAALATFEQRRAVMRRALAPLDARAESMKHSLPANTDLRVAALMDRGHAGRFLQNIEPRRHWINDPENLAYHASTYSFQFALRDDPGNAVTRNHWELLFQMGRLYSSGVAGSRSRIWLLPDGVDASMIRSNTLGDAQRRRFEPKAGANYLVHVLRSETDKWIFLKVLEHRAGESLIFAWRNLNPSEVSDDIYSHGRELMQDPRVVVRIRKGIDGQGKVYLDRSNGDYSEKLTHVGAGRVRELPINLREKTEAGMIGGGILPEGQTWVVTSVRWEGAIKRDGYGFSIVLGEKEIVEVEDVQPWTTGEWRGRIELRGFETSTSFVEANDRSAVEVIFEGHFEYE
jgi:RNA polymerase sigma-70 factor, ECF subfamily